MKVVVDGKQLRRFRRRALKAFPLEYVEALWGTATPEALTIKAFVSLPHTAQQINAACSVCGNRDDSTSLNYEDKSIRKLKKDALSADLQFLGTIHSHPERKADTYPSDTDNEVSRKHAELVMGIMAIWESEVSKRKRSNVKWWTPQLALQDISILQ